MIDNNSLHTDEYYKNLNKHENCSKCDIVLTRDNYKKDRTVCRMCYNNNVLTYYKNKFGVNSSIKTDTSTQTDFSDVCNSLINQDMVTNKSTSNVSDNSNKKIISKKRTSSNKKDRSIKNDNINIQECSNIEDISINNILDADPNLLCDKLQEIVKKPVRSESDYITAQMIIDELYRTKCIPRKQYKALCEKIKLVKNNGLLCPKK